MRSGLVFAMSMLATSCNPSEDCVPTVRSHVRHFPSAIASGTDLIGVSWKESIGNNRPIGHAVIVDAAGTQANEIQVDPDARGVAGHESVLWGRTNSANIEACSVRGGPLDVTLHRTDRVEHVHIADATGSSTASTFDGTRYQLFWIEADGHLRTRALDENGTLGVVQDLIAIEPDLCIVAASDGAGVTMLRVGTRVYAVEAGAVRMVLERPQLTNLYHYAGEFHVRAVGDLISFTSTSSMLRPRRLPLFLAGAQAFYPSTGALFVVSDGAVHAVDAALENLGLVDADTNGGTFDGDFVSIVHYVPGDAPASLGLEGRGETVLLATDSELQDVCE